MNVEMLYTSAPQGLKQGSRGFCTVLCTTGLPINLAQRLEALSGYRHLYQPGDPRSDANPVCYSHLRFSVGGRTLSVLSRLAAYGVDYSQRTNKIAHHVVMDDPLPSCGPAAILGQSGAMRSEWNGTCETLASGPTFADPRVEPKACVGWSKVTGDAGWAGVVANAWIQPTGKPVWIIFEDSQSPILLSMMQEAIALLPEKLRWKATFSTYCNNLPPDVDCKIRCVTKGSEEARMSSARGTVIDISKPMTEAPTTPASIAARQGKIIGEVRPPSPTRSANGPQNVPTNDAMDFDFLEGVVTPKVDDSEYELKPLESQSKTRSTAIPAPRRIESRRGKLTEAPSYDDDTERSVMSYAPVIAAAILFLVLGLAGVYAVLGTPKKIAHEIDDLSPTPSETVVNPAEPLKDNSFDSPSAPETDLTVKQPPTTSPPSKREIVLRIEDVLQSEFLKSEIKKGTEKILAKVTMNGLDVEDDQEIQIVTDPPDAARNFDVKGKFHGIKGKFLRWNGNSELQFKTEKLVVGIRLVINGVDSLPSESERVSFTFTKDPEPDLDFKIVDASGIQSQNFVAGTILTGKLLKGVNLGIDNFRKRLKWHWEFADIKNENWQEHPSMPERTGTEMPEYEIKNTDYAKRIRLRLSYSSPNQDAPIVNVSRNVVTTLPQIDLVLPFTNSLFSTDAKGSLSKHEIEFAVPEHIVDHGVASEFEMTYDIEKTRVKNGKLKLQVDKLLSKKDIQGLEGKFNDFRATNESFVGLVNKFQGQFRSAPNKDNPILSFLRASLFSTDEKHGDGFEFAIKSRKHQAFVSMLDRFYAFDHNKKENHQELAKLRKEIMDYCEKHSKIKEPPAQGKKEKPDDFIDKFRKFWTETGNDEAPATAWGILMEQRNHFESNAKEALNKTFSAVSVGKIVISKPSTGGRFAVEGDGIIAFPLPVVLRLQATPEMENNIKEFGK